MSRFADAGAGSALLERSLLSLCSPGGKRGLSILIYHRVLPVKDALFPGEVDRREFSDQMALLKSRFNVLPLAQAVAMAKRGSLPPRAAAITFDDGYADNAELALPVLREHGLHATFFVASGFLNGGRMWNDSVIELVRRTPDEVLDASALGLGVHALRSVAERQRAIPALIGQLKYLPMVERLEKVERLAALAHCALPDDLMMTTAQVRALRAAGMDIGAHTVNHPILARLPDAQAREEIAQGKLALEDILGEKVVLFAYPNGKPGEDYLPQHVTMARDLRFEGAVSTAWGASRGEPDPFQLPRFTPWDRNRLRFLLRLARNLTVPAGRA